MVPFNYQSQHFYLTIPSKPWPPAPLHGIIAAAARSIQRQRDCKVFSCAPGVTQSFHTLFTPRMRMKGQSLHWVQVRFSIIHQLQNAGSNYIIIIYNYICICVFYVYIYIYKPTIKSVDTTEKNLQNHCAEFRCVVDFDYWDRPKNCCPELPRGSSKIPAPKHSMALNACLYFPRTSIDLTWRDCGHLWAVQAEHQNANGVGRQSVHDLPVRLCGRHMNSGQNDLFIFMPCTN